MKTITEDNATYHVGQNINENDELFYSVKGNCYWFHYNNSPSCHVYCVVDKLTKTHIKKAAILVRQYSNGSDSVIYACKKDIKRLGPGLIDVDKFKKA